MDNQNNNNKPRNNRQGWSVIIITTLLAIFVVMGLYSLMQDKNPQEISYYKFLKMVDDGKVDKVKISSSRIYITLKDGVSVKEELDDVREKGYALDREELELGLTCIGAPILDRSGHAIAAISLSGPKSRMLAGDFCERVRAVTEAARKISTNF